VVDLIWCPGFTVSICHRKCERGFRDVVDLKTEIRSVPGGSLATLFGANAADYNVLDAVLNEPDVQSGADQGAVTAFIKDRIRRDGELGQSLHVTRCERKRTFVRDMEDLQDGNTVSLGPINQGLHADKKSRSPFRLPEGSLAKRFLNIDHD